MRRWIETLSRKRRCIIQRCCGKRWTAPADGGKVNEWCNCSPLTLAWSGELNPSCCSWITQWLTVEEYSERKYSVVIINRSSFLQLQRELNTRRGDSMDVNDGSSASRGIFSPQDSPRNTPRSPRSPRSPCTSTPIQAPPMRSHSDSEAMLEEQGAAIRLKGPAENLFLDALSLDPLSGLEVPPPCRLESEKRFPCMKEVTHCCYHKAPVCKSSSTGHFSTWFNCRTGCVSGSEQDFGNRGWSWVRGGDGRRESAQVTSWPRLESNWV